MKTDKKQNAPLPRQHKSRPRTYDRPKYRQTSAILDQSTEGETLEMKIERIVNNKEPIKDGAPMIYTERSEGIRPSTNIRTDRWEIAIDATEKIAKSYKARREERAKAPDPKREDGGAESIHGKGKPTTGG